MRFAETADMHKLIKAKWTSQLILDTFKLHDIPINMTWIHKDKLEEVCCKYAIERGWDPETTFVWWSLPPDPEPDVGEDIPNKFAGALVGLSKMNSTQCICLLFQNMTPEKLVGLIDQVVNMKVFL